MVYGSLENRARYACLGREVMAALDYFAAVLVERPSLEKADVSLPYGMGMVKIRPMSTKPANECAWEAHDTELDIHFLAYGEEKIGIANRGDLQVTATDSQKDMIWLSGSVRDAVTILPGMFLIVYPEDAHMPCIAPDTPAPIGKMIAKIKVPQC